MHLPTQATLLITNRCNLTCDHCYTSANDKYRSELSTNDWKRVIDLCAKAPLFIVYIGGGEGFLRADYAELLNYGVAQGLTMTSTTNGTYATIDNLAQIDKRVRFQVSIDGDMNRHDELRGRGSFKRALAACQNLKRLDREVVVGTVVTKNNVDFVEVIKTDVIDKVMPDLWHVMRIQPGGRGRLNYQSLSVSNREWVKAVTYLNGLRNQGVQISIDSSYDLTGVESIARDDAWLYRSFGVDLCVWPDGRITPGDLFEPEDWTLANVNEISCLFELVRSSPVLHKLEAAQQRAPQGKCSNCVGRSVCQGGSRASTYALTGSLDGIDPFCPHTPPNYAY